MIKYTNAVLWLVSVLMVSAIMVMDANAIEVQWAQGWTADCDNATQRTDGSALSTAEIEYVEYRVTPSTGGNATYTVLMTGGCKPTYIDTKQFIPVGTYLLTGVTVDTDGRVSVPSDPGIELTVMKAKPKPPSGLR